MHTHVYDDRATFSGIMGNGLPCVGGIPHLFPLARPNPHLSAFPAALTWDVLMCSSASPSPASLDQLRKALLLYVHWFLPSLSLWTRAAHYSRHCSHVVIEYLK